jgi:2-polyprenyl-6-methoxyphenol hydroxylase-like FAD-dependent oxidoreductase
MKQSNGSILFQSNFDDSNNNQSTWLSINESTTENVSIKKELFRNGKTVINRGALRDLMLQEVMENYGDQCTIRWNSKIVDFKVYHPNDGSRCSENLPVEVFLDDGNKLQGDILLGCDGIFSKVRELLPNCIPGVYPSNPKLRYLDVAWVRGVCSKRHIELNNES